MAGLALGVPTVTSVGHLSEPLWAESGAGALASPPTAAGFLNVVEKMIADEQWRLHLSTDARRLYAERFSIERTIDALRSRSRRSEHGSIR